jgi:hypothetical protein
MKTEYQKILAKSKDVSDWDLPENEKEIVRKHFNREHNRRHYPIAGRSELIMRNRVIRSKSFGIVRDNRYV